MVVVDDSLDPTPPPRRERDILMPAPHTVLVIDNDPLLRASYRDLLKTEGFSVVEASNGADALIWFQRGTANIILLDLEMPVLDGRTFLEYRLRHPTLRAIPVLVLSNQLAEAGLRQALDYLGVNRLLEKPVAREDLLDVVREVLAEIRTVASATEVEEAGGRRDPRIAFTVRLRVRTKTSLETAGTLHDLSAGGLGAFLPDRIAHGEAITLSLDIEGRSLVLGGVVRWAGESLTAMGYCHGILFTEKQEDAFPLHVYSFFRERPQARD